MHAIGRPDLAGDQRLAENAGRVKHAELIDESISSWTEQHSFDEIMEKLDEAGVPAGGIYSIADIAVDPHYQAREMIQEFDIPSVGRRVKLPGIIPRYSESQVETTWVGPELGQHNDEIYGDLLGLSPAEINALKKDSVI
jgi:formyl-CoA transferase